MPRLFTALEIPREIALSLSMLRGGLPGARWIDPENYHLTLRFIGDVDDVLAHEIASLLDQVDLESVELDLRDDRDCHTVGSPQESEWSGDDLVECEWDLNDVVSTALIGAEFHCGVTPPGKCDDGRMTVRQASADYVDELRESVEVDKRDVRSPFA